MFARAFKVLAAATSGALLATAPMLMKTKQDNEGRVPGDRETYKTRIGETLASITQSHTPMNEFHTHTVEIPMVVGKTDKQLITHCYTNHINEDFMQSVLFDSDSKDARMIGVSYTITERIFNELPDEERKLWSSNAYGVKSGLTVAPRMPWTVEHRLMSDLAPTYSKSYMTWDVRDPLPLGIPSLLVKPTRDGMIRNDMLRKRDEELNINTEAERKNREDIPMPKILPGADSWEKGEMIMLQAKVSGGTRMSEASKDRQPSYSR